MSALLDSFKAAFDNLPTALADAQGLGDARRSALSHALANDMPSLRNERWKYTPLRALSARSFTTLPAIVAIDPILIANIPSPRLVFINGHYDAALSVTHNLENGLSVQALSQALQGNDARSVNFLGRRFDHVDEVFAFANAALAVEGAVVRVAEGANIATPLHLVFIGSSMPDDLIHHQRHLIELRENAALAVIEHHIASGANRHLANHLLHVHLKPGSRLLHARVQEEDDGASLITRTDAVLAADADYRRLDLELGAALSRHELNVSLQGDRAHVAAAGALLAGGRRHIDTRLDIEHVARDTSCDLRWRGLAADRGKVVFHGGIRIRTGADGSDAKLSSKNLLFSETAEINTQPVLEIHADEVKAAHGATVGQLDSSTLFYLRSRGIPHAQARAMLTLAFCREVLATLDNTDLINLLSPRLENRLQALEAIA